MKVVVLYRPNSEHARTVETFARDFEHQHYGAKIELVSLDTRDGASTASMYDIVRYPSILALQDNGQLLKDWQGDSMPLMNEVAYYASDPRNAIMRHERVLSPIR